ncbi:hypothetical protein E2H86_23895 [Pseudomonas putida]|uniref:hypothetical protein n=1 Tax=Pseudomonas putida TaxID=303 RepID=UPI00105A6403|nr:hypothetical protein [Pseudomonas putida]TDJ73317.1 hypothetical protein E2H86_23895 [Pseudomonas putida]
MVTNIIEQRIAESTEDDMINGWGGVLMLRRGPANALLRARYVQAFQDDDILWPITGTGYVDAGRTEQFVFEDLMLGPPQLSFEEASGRTGTVTVAMELIAGRCVSTVLQPGSPKRLRRSHTLQLGMGHTLRMRAQLVVVSGTDGLPELAIDWGTATAMRCSLGVSDAAAGKMGDFIFEQVRTQRLFSQVFSFITLDNRLVYNAISVLGAGAFTLAAPEDPGQASSDEGDGALLLALHLKGTGRPGLAGNGWPWPFAASEDADTEPDTALLLGRRRDPLDLESVEGESTLARAMAEQVIMAGNYRFEWREESKPHHRVLLGTIAASPRQTVLNPALARIGVGQTMQLDAEGQRLIGWQARNIVHPRASGQMSNGTYSATPLERLATDQQIVAVTARSDQDEEQSVRAALLVETAEPLAISPRVVIWSPELDPVPLVASGDTDLKWTLEGEAYGTLLEDQEDSRHAVFTPNEPSGDQNLLLQRIKVSDGESAGHATVVILGSPAVLDVEPYHVPNIPASGSERFSLLDGDAEKWLLFGPGEIDEDTGVYTAPDTYSGEVSVVVGVSGRHAGLAVVQHQQAAPQRSAVSEERWKELVSFTVKLNNAARNVAFCNGAQQIGIDIEIATQSFPDSNGEDVFDPISDLELSTLKLIDRSGVELPYIVDEIMPTPAAAKWAVSRRRNRFDYYPSAVADEAVPHADGNGKRNLTLYVQTLEAEVLNIRAKFQDHYNGWRTSSDLDEEAGEVQVEGKELPLPDLANYFWGEQGSGKRVEEKNGSNVGEDRFNYWHYTTDYYVLRSAYFQFVHVIFNTCSMIKWESEQEDETFCSYTGYAFTPRRNSDMPAAPKGVEYEGALQMLTIEEKVNFGELDYGFKGQEAVATGQLLVTLDRVSTMNYWQDSGSVENHRAILDQAMEFTLIDNFGTKHPLRVTFGGGEDGRNILHLGLQ